MHCGDYVRALHDPASGLLLRRWSAERTEEQVRQCRETAICTIEALAARYRCLGFPCCILRRLRTFSRKEDANKDFLRHSSNSVKALACEVCLPLLWQLAEMSEIEDVACLEFFTEGQQA